MENKQCHSTEIKDIVCSKTLEQTDPLGTQKYIAREESICCFTGGSGDILSDEVHQGRTRSLPYRKVEKYLEYL